MPDQLALALHAEHARPPARRPHLGPRDQREGDLESVREVAIDLIGHPASDAGLVTHHEQLVGVIGRERAEDEARRGDHGASLAHRCARLALSAASPPSVRSSSVCSSAAVHCTLVSTYQDILHSVLETKLWSLGHRRSLRPRRSPRASGARLHSP